MREGECFKMDGMMVREFRGQNFVSPSKEKCRTEGIADLEDIEEEHEEKATVYYAAGRIMQSN